MSTVARPFPWYSLESTTRDDAATVSAASRWGARHVDLEGFGPALQNLFGVPIELRLRRLHPLVGARAFDEAGLGWAFSIAEARSGEVGGVVQVEGALGAVVAARLLQRTAPRIVDRASSLESVGGALAAVFCAASRRARGESPIRIAAVGSAREIEAGVASQPAGWLAAEITALVADEAFSVRILLPRSLGIGAGDSDTWSRGALRSLGGLVLSMPLVACVFDSTVGEIASLRPGDAVIPGTWALARRPTDKDVWQGAVTLAAPESDMGVRSELTDLSLVLTGEIDSLASTEAPMNESDEKDPLVETLGDVPVVVRVEVGEARMSAREWAGLRGGDIITLGRRIGERVVLRVGGVPLARGELVDVEGEVGVRVLERLGEGDPA